MKIRIVSAEMGKPTFFMSAYRNLGKVVSSIPSFWGFLRILSPNYKQTIHDYQCYVVVSSHEPSSDDVYERK